MDLTRQLVLVTGSAGWIGRRVCWRLYERGIAVAAFDRVLSDGPWARAIVGELEHFGELSDDLQRLLQATSTVIHCAGRAHRPVETVAEIKAFTRSNVVGTRDLLKACKCTGVQRVIYVSTIAGYDWTKVPIGGQTEEGPLFPSTAYARTKLEGETAVRESGLDWRAVRLATVFGAGDRANFATLAAALRRGRFVVPGVGGTRKSVIPLDLAAEALVRLALVVTPRHRLMNASLPRAPTLREICDIFSLECGFAKAYAAPMSLLQAGAWIGDLAVKVFPGFPLTTSTLAKLTTSTVVTPARLYETLPDLPRLTFAEALRPAAEYYRNV